MPAVQAEDYSAVLPHWPWLLIVSAKVPRKTADDGPNTWAPAAYTGQEGYADSWLGPGSAPTVVAFLGNEPVNGRYLSFSLFALRKKANELTGIKKNCYIRMSSLLIFSKCAVWIA